MKRIASRTLLLVTVFSFSMVVLSQVNPGSKFGLKLEDYDLVSRQEVTSQHIIGYGIDVEKVELFYQGVRNMLGANNVNSKVKVYAAKPKWEEGQIVEYEGRRFYGVFRPSAMGRTGVIIYNGNESVLIHELSHFFYNGMTPYQRDEVFARMSEGFAGLLENYVKLIKVLQGVVNEAYKMSHPAIVSQN